MDETLIATLVDWRRQLHARPELSGHEAGTAQFVQDRLRAMEIPFVAGVGGHGIVATLTRGGSDRSVGLRADMDALPIHEDTGAPHASITPGVMHACGHDGHTVSLLGAAALLRRDPAWHGTIQLVFQPAEEDGSGARAMMADGLFERFPMERIFGYHNWPGMTAGTVGVHDGAVMAQGGRIVLTVTGHAGHGAKPNETRDPIVAAAHLIVALQTVVARNIDPFEPAVITIGSINGGTANNQIPGTVTLRGTIRSLGAGQRETIVSHLRRVCDGIGATFGVTVELDAATGGRVTANSPAEAELAAAAALEAGLAVERNLRPSMTGEDFSRFLAERPGAFVWIGNGQAGRGNQLHNPGYDFNDAILPGAASWLAAVAKLALS